MGWLFFLKHFGLGGCLADDMGLGKTVQVLALLESRRPSCHSLVVVPRSLIFNWRQEAARFTPDMRVLDNSGQDRVKDAQELLKYDVVLTTYGTLCRDITWLKDVTFDYVILDEAQAIKNADTYSAKAARLLNGKHRLALSGTPIENHLGELWSIFEFLNPGMLGTVSCFNSGVSRNQIDYVFLLDPWWNPAVEAQAIDRTHRIGQTQKVFAYRLIARDTVEEKVIELQSSKRRLADAIINADNSLIRDLTRKDLELLLQ